MRAEKGLTLVEIMIALAIMAILTAIAIPAYDSYMREGRIGGALKDLRQAEMIFSDFAMDRNLAALDGDDPNLLNVYTDGDGLRAAAAAPAGAAAWLDPWGNVYRYRRPAVFAVGGLTSNPDLPGRQGFDLFSSGPDGVAGNADDIVRGCNGEFMGERDDHPAAC